MFKVNISNGILSDSSDKISNNNQLWKIQIKVNHSYFAIVKIFARVKTMQRKKKISYAFRYYSSQSLLLVWYWL